MIRVSIHVEVVIQLKLIVHNVLLLRYDGIRAQVKKQHPDVELTRGFSRSLLDKRQSPRAVSPLVVVQTEESCSCKYYNFVSFLINNGINIEKVKENRNLLMSIDNLK